MDIKAWQKRQGWILKLGKRRQGWILKLGKRRQGWLEIGGGEQTGAY